MLYFKLIMLGIVLAILDVIIFSFFYLIKVGLGNPYKKMPQFSMLEFLIDFLSSFLGGGLLLSSILLISWGIVLLNKKTKDEIRKIDGED